MEYEHPRGSGEWKYRYIQVDHSLLAMMNRNTPGLFLRYAEAIGFLMWLFDARNVELRGWMQLPMSLARVLQLSFNKTTNTIGFGPVIKPIEMFPCTKRFGDDIFDLMKKHGVGRTPAALPACEHRRCDFCLVIRFTGKRSWISAAMRERRTRQCLYEL